MDPADKERDDQTRDDAGGDVEKDMRWPQRPTASSPRAEGLDPSGRGHARALGGDNPPRSAGGISPWTATPTDPNATRELPVVDRFGAGRSNQPSAPSSPQRTQPSQPPQHPQSALGDTQIAGPGDLPYGRSPGRYEDETIRYTPAMRPQARPLPPIQNPRAKVQNGDVQLEENYVDPRVDPRHIMREARRGGRKGRYRWLLWAVLGLLTVVLLAGVAFTLAWQGQYAGKIY